MRENGVGIVWEGNCILVNGVVRVLWVNDILDGVIVMFMDLIYEVRGSSEFVYNEYNFDVWY